MSARRNQHLENAAFDMDDVGVKDSFLPGDIKYYLYENLTSHWIDYDWSVDYAIKYKQFLVD